jgi:uncharacterized protein YbjT (DUF2867 family)
MILVTGGTGFIGQALIRRLAETGYRIRTLLRPSKKSPNVPKGVTVEAVVCSLADERGLRAAMKGVQGVFHLAGSEYAPGRADLQGVDIDGTRAVAQAASEADVSRLIYLSHLGADRASAYPVLKSKGIAERFIQQSSVPSTVLRTALVYGAGDHFTEPLARLLLSNPWFFLLPGEGDSHIQPIWVEDLVTALVLALEDPQSANQTYAIGGPEYLTFRQVTEIVANALHLKRRIIPVSPAYLRILSIWMEQSWKNYPISIFWQDYLSVDRTCELDVLPRKFGLMPERFAHRLDHLLSPFDG